MSKNSLSTKNGSFILNKVVKNRKKNRSELLPNNKTVSRVMALSSRKAILNGGSKTSKYCAPAIVTMKITNSVSPLFLMIYSEDSLILKLISDDTTYF
ncbi:MAG: hypothetical protein M3421_01765 [Bacteroidota bacterium]|nr:hypothetical protein [Bacteroidota bacterium]